MYRVLFTRLTRKGFLSKRATASLLIKNTVHAEEKVCCRSGAKSKSIMCSCL